MNAFWEYRDFAAADGIPVLDSRMDVLLTHFSGGAAAPMLSELSNNWRFVLEVYGIKQVISALLFNSSPGAGGLLADAAWNALWTYLVAYMPDVVYNYGNRTLDNGFAASDQIKETLYHEFAHSSHFTQVSHLYWINNIVYVVENNGYGDGTANGAGRCAVIEMWGHHIGPTYADQQYGLEHSNPVLTGESIDQNRHICILEEDVFWNNTTRFIPIGLDHDLIDNNLDNPVGVTEPGIIIDNVSGFTNGQIIGAMNQDIITVEAFRDRLRTNSLGATSNTLADYNALFASYGF